MNERSDGQVDVVKDLEGAIDEVDQASRVVFEQVLRSHLGEALPGELLGDLNPIVDALARRFVAAPSAATALESELRRENARWVGPSGLLTEKLKRIPEVPKERRRELGQRGNAVKQAVEAKLAAVLGALARALREAELRSPAVTSAAGACTR